VVVAVLRLNIGGGPGDLLGSLFLAERQQDRHIPRRTGARARNALPHSQQSPTGGVFLTWWA
jgi:hypothetical protein